MIVLICVISLAVLIATLHFMAGKEMRIEQSIKIAKPAGLVFDYLKFTKNQDYFSVWNMADPNMKKTYHGTDGQVGFIYKWDSTNNNVGEGEQETTNIVSERRIEYEVRFKRPMQNVAKIQFEIESEGNSVTLVKWVFNSPSKFPMTIFKSIFIKMLSKDLQSGLANLKRFLEQQS